MVIIITSWNNNLLGDNGEGGLGCYAAHVAPCPRHPHVAPLAPVGAPTVLQDVVFLSGVLVHPVAHGQDRVVKVNCAALVTSVNASTVMIKTPMACIYSHGDRALKEKF